MQGSSAPTDSTSESDSSSDSDSSDDEEPSKVNIKDRDAEEDDESGVVAPTTTYFQTKNELVETDIVVPDIEQVGSEEILERVGDVMSIIDRTVIIKGAPSELASRALDCDTLLVFEDRKVLGYIYETFGPTTQPLYQVKFSASYPVDHDKVQLSRPVFHVPQRSNFVFVNQIKRFKGSDASNMHDEEPADDELEFSDDEAEAAYKSSLKRKRESRANSVASSRQGTPSPASMRDQDLALLERNPYDDHSPYDDNFGSGPSRPAPMPYDDPYSDEYNNVTPANVEPAPLAPPAPRSRTNSGRDDSEGFASRPRGRGRGSGFDRSEGRGSGRGRGRGERGKAGRGRGNHDRGPRQPDERTWDARGPSMPRRSMEPQPYDSHQPPPRPLSPTSMAIARATGQFSDGSEFTQQQQSHSAPSTPTAPWGFDPSQQFNYGYQPFVQPHINPRFTSAFGMNFDFQHPQPYYQPPPSNNGSSWTDEWTVHSGGGNDSSNTGA
ncbi:Gar1/Naf1 RNA binding region-domain-containing protein [Mycena rosella]|uniref:H/ACA ribonucleoprotein complex non-core subunit NAF1 n=1 Tax=Mycena rosella TaxID=1033263 RepID=A0AAD7CR33_MYCRO|nr:Gar1/Naf1 RNA binding region-domain-containing protein [Mycena rosella]